MVSFEYLALKCFLIIFCYLSVLTEACVIRKVCRVDDSCCHPLSEGSLDIIPGIDISVPLCLDPATKITVGARLICFLLSTVACAGCNVLGAIRANCWLLAHGQGIFCTVKLMFFSEP